tara:strand:- start:1755 stop:2195 length:441 start_codon:yes stop_codon:yes gene_type:complete
LTTPRLVNTLAVFGIAPFLIALSLPESWSLTVFKLYSTAILCFLSGSWWSTALVSTRHDAPNRWFVMLLSNLAVLLAVLLAWLDHSLTIPGLATLYVLLLLGEQRLSVFSRQPNYYQQMRQWVTGIVVLLHLFAWWTLNEAGTSWH